MLPFLNVYDRLYSGDKEVWRLHTAVHKRTAEQAHLACSHSDPLVLSGVEPGEAKGVLAIDVHVLAVGEPPTSLVVTGAVGV